MSSYNALHDTKYHSPILLDLLFILIPGTLLICAPAIFYGCCKSVQPVDTKSRHEISKHYLYLTKIGLTHAGSTLDILTFEDDKLQRMDTYQRFEDFHDTIASVGSTGGKKLFFVCTDSHKDRYDWSSISSYNSLKKISSDLEDETAGQLVKTGECRASAGSQCSISLSPISCCVTLASISCDFSGTPYSESVITDVKAYLTNVNATYPIVGSEDTRPSGIINAGMFNSFDVSRFKDPGIISRHIADELGKETLFPKIDFICYPNIHEEDSPGCPYTKIVIEGDIGPDTYYWPIEIHGDDIGESKGVKRNCHYIYDLMIRRKGVSDPDISIEPQDSEIKVSVRSWKEKEDYGIVF